MRIAVIDCGTNTFNLLIVDVKNQSFENIHSSKIPVKLGEGGINNGCINEVPFQRGIDALISFKNQTEKMKVNGIHAFATSAIRDAKNGIQFKEEALLKTGICISIIDGNKEADYIYEGNKRAVNLTANPSLIMDIGGGSTEFIIGTRDKILWKKSYRLGGARLLDRFKPNNPISLGEILVLNNYLNEQLEDLIIAVKEFGPNELVGSSGAFDSVVELIHGQLRGERFIKSKTEYEVDLDNYFNIAKTIISSTIEERRTLKGLVEMRVDMIVISCLLINFVLETLNIKEMRISTYSLKEGALSEIIQNTKS